MMDTWWIFTTLHKSNHQLCATPSEWSLSSYYGLTTSTVKCQSYWTQVKCLKSTGRFHHFCPLNYTGSQIKNKAWTVLVHKHVRYGFADQTDFEQRPLACKNVSTVQIRRKSVGLPSLTDQTIILNHCIPGIIMKQLYLSDIIDEVDNVCLLNNHKIITSLYLSLFCWNSRIKNMLCDDSIIGVRPYRQYWDGFCLVCKSGWSDCLLSLYFALYYPHYPMHNRRIVHSPAGLTTSYSSLIVAFLAALAIPANTKHLYKCFTNVLGLILYTLTLL